MRRESGLRLRSLKLRVCRRCEYPGYLDGYLGIVLAKAFRFMIF